MNTSYVVIFITAKDVDEAKKIARRLLEEKLIACANILSGVRSLFWWQGKVDDAEEALLIMKTRQRLFPKIRKTVQSLHSYDVPEIIALPLVDGNKEYLHWIDESVREP